MALSCAYLMGNIVLYIGLERWPHRRYPRIGSTLSRDWTKSYTAGDSNARHCTPLCPPEVSTCFREPCLPRVDCSSLHQGRAG